jgi:hypothetical protein
VDDSFDVEPPYRTPSVSPAASVPDALVAVEEPAASIPDALVAVEDLLRPDGGGGGVDNLPSARAPSFGTGSPDFSGPEAASKAGIGASNPLGGPYWAKSREPLVTRVSSNKPIRSLAALSFSSTNLTMESDIRLISSKMWRPQCRSLFSTRS